MGVTWLYYLLGNPAIEVEKSLEMGVYVKWDLAKYIQSLQTGQSDSLSLFHTHTHTHTHMHTCTYFYVYLPFCFGILVNVIFLKAVP